MKRIIVLIMMSFLLSSCVVSTAAKVVKTTAKIGVSAVKGTVKGISWSVKKDNGKINENRLDGTWKVVGVYNGNYEQYSKDVQHENNIIYYCVRVSVQDVIESM